MVDFEIICYRNPPQRIFAFGSPSSIIAGKMEPTILKFECGLQFAIADGLWWYQPSPREYDLRMYHGLEIVSIHELDIYDPNKPYTIDEILDISQEYIQDTIIFNLDIFRKVS